ncbi:MAG: hypothetical protein A3K19_30220 [Lentisphaerae bacterium RIFOXYB12_FULL_65_16]|nr:MAG: hypothetical protein A3K18_29585 [Lentisphaerae bacterium RIFOXYA12_64_32]OGV85850.1 MAG: hypothetical protein A3K19_30220 [Lentisphaerae bacterium RIFOXYB12_FULL_65_16]
MRCGAAAADGGKPGMEPSACLVVANAILAPPLFGDSRGSVLLFIPVVLIEALFVGAFVARQWRGALRLSAIANTLSLLVGLSFVSILPQVPPREGGGFFILVGACFLVTFLIECEYVRRAATGANPLVVLATTAGMNTASYAFLVALAVALTPSVNRYEAARRAACASNLKTFGMILFRYADDNAGQFPPYLYQLRYSGLEGLLTCPSIATVVPDVTSSRADFRTDYVYESPGKLADPRQAAAIPIAWDKPENHKVFGNVLFADGHVKGFAGKDWLAKARPAK